jgi:hypothetical protein
MLFIKDFQVGAMSKLSCIFVIVASIGTSEYDHRKIESSLYFAQDANVIMTL